MLHPSQLSFETLNFQKYSYMMYRLGITLSVEAKTIIYIASLLISI